MQQFAAVAQKYASLGYTRKGDYIVAIAMSPQDLIREGETLHHCVGKMNYDQKFAKEQSLIFFFERQICTRNAACYNGILAVAKEIVTMLRRP